MRSSPGVKSALDQSALYVHFLLAKSHVLLQLNRVCQYYTMQFTEICRALVLDLPSFLIFVIPKNRLFTHKI